MSIARNRPVVPPTPGDAGLRNFAQIIDKNIADLSQVAHVHKIVTEAPADNDGNVGDIYIVDTGKETYLTVKTADLGWVPQAGNVVNVKNFGAKGDGRTDDSLAFQAAITAIGTGEIYCPAGTYNISVNVDNKPISFRGDINGTFFHAINGTDFMLNYHGDSNTRKRFIRDITFEAVTPQVGRGVYSNSLGFINMHNCRFQNLEYGVYTNGNNWNHFIECYWLSCNYGLFTTTLNNDLLGLNPTLAQNSSASVVVQCSFWYNQVGFYNDSPNDIFGDSQPAWSFMECEFLVNDCAVAALGGLLLYMPLLFDWCWFEQNLTSGTHTANGNVINNGDMHFANGTLFLKNVFNAGGRWTLKSGANVIGTNVNLLSATILQDADVTVNFDNLLLDNNGGSIFSDIRAKSLRMYREDRAAGAMTTPKTAFSVGLSAQNVMATTSTCTRGPLPTTVAGTPTTAFVLGDGLYGNSCVQISGSSGDQVYWSGNVTAHKFYAASFAVKSTTAGNTIDVLAGGAAVFPGGTIKLGTTWKTIGVIGSPSTSASAQLYFSFTSTHVLRVSCFQLVEFDTLVEAMAYLDSDAFALKLSEVPNRDLTLSASPASGTWAVGDIVWDAAPTSGGHVGWICTTAGSPGTWKTWGVIS